MWLGEVEEMLCRCLGFPPELSTHRHGHPDPANPVYESTNTRSPALRGRVGICTWIDAQLCFPVVWLYQKNAPFRPKKRAGTPWGMGWGDAGLENEPLHLAIKFGLETSSCFLTKSSVFSTGSNTRKSRVIKGRCRGG